MRKTKYQLVLLEAGALYQIKAVVLTSIAVEITDTYCNVREPVAQFIMREMDKGIAVTFPKTKKDDLKQGDLIHEEATDLDKRKNEEISQYRQQISQLFVNMNFMTMYRFIMLNNRFCSVGAFIHEENREEAYLKIINSGNESMVDDLEEFLESQDELSALYKTFKKFTNAIHQLTNVTTEEELDTIINNLPNV